MIYFILDEKKEYLKIGYSTNCNKRLQTLQSSNPRELFLIHFLEGDVKKENELHKLLKEKVYNGEWYIYSEISNFLIENKYLPDDIDISIEDIFSGNLLVQPIQKKPKWKVWVEDDEPLDDRLLAIMEYIRNNGPEGLEPIYTEDDNGNVIKQ